MEDDATNASCSTSSNAFAQTSPVRSPVKCIQPSRILSSDTQREPNLRKLLKNLQEENDALKKRNRKLEEQTNELSMKLHNVQNSITFDQLKDLIFKFCPSSETAELINRQLTQLQNAPKGRRHIINLSIIFL